MTTLTLPVKELNKALTIFAPLTRKSSLPVLNTMLVTVMGERVILAATNLKTYASMDLYSNSTCRDFTINVAELAKVMKSTKALTVDFTPADDYSSVKVAIGNLTATISSIDPHEFPFRPFNLDSIAICELNSKSLRHALTLTDMAAEHDGIREILNTVYIDIKDKRVTFVGCDGKQLSEVVVTDILSHGTANAMVSVLAVKTALTSIDKKLHTPVRVEILASDKSMGNPIPYIEFRIDNVTILTRGCEGTYPDYNVIIPRTMTNTYRIIPRELAEATEPMKGAYCFVARFGSNGHVDLIQHDKSLPALNTLVLAHAIAIDPDNMLAIALNPGFIHLFAKSAHAAGVQDMTWGVNDKSKPVLFEGTLDTGEGYKYVLMPMYMPVQD